MPQYDASNRQGLFMPPPPPVHRARRRGSRQAWRRVAIGLGEEVSVVVVGESHARMAGSSRDLRGVDARGREQTDSGVFQVMGARPVALTAGRHLPAPVRRAKRPPIRYGKDVARGCAARYVDA